MYLQTQDIVQRPTHTLLWLVEEEGVDCVLVDSASGFFSSVAMVLKLASQTYGAWRDEWMCCFKREPFPLTGEQNWDLKPRRKFNTTVNHKRTLFQHLEKHHSRAHNDRNPHPQENRCKEHLTIPTSIRETNAADGDKQMRTNATGCLCLHAHTFVQHTTARPTSLLIKETDPSSLVLPGWCWRSFFPQLQKRILFLCITDPWNRLLHLHRDC